MQLLAETKLYSTTSSEMPSRSTRRQKPINYRALDGDTSDDDFNVPTPPSKRVCTQKGSERAAEFADGAGPSSARPSLDDKLFKKQLMIALEKSKSDSQATSDASSQDHSIKSADTVPMSQEDLAPSPAARQATSQDTDSTQESAKNEDEWAADSGSSEDSEAEESGDDSGSSEDSEAEESGDDSGSDDEFKSKRPTAKKGARSKPSKPAQPPARNARSPGGVQLATAGMRTTSVKKQCWTVSAAPEVASRGLGPPSRGLEPPSRGPDPPSRAVLKARNCAPSSPVATPAAAAEGRICGQKWRPPGRSSETPDQKLLSPSAGGLRLGLSRNRRLKPLHPTARPLT